MSASEYWRHSGMKQNHNGVRHSQKANCLGQKGFF